jgi:acetylornithine aminotransferase
MSIQQRWDAVMMPNYGTPPIALDHGRGVRVWDTDGNEYLDFVAGIAVSSLGHAHPAIVAAVSEQVGRLAHTSNLVMHEPGVRLAERLVELLAQPARVFFANSGAEANECALKLARLHGIRDGRRGQARAVRAAARPGHLRRLRRRRGGASGGRPTDRRGDRRADARRRWRRAAARRLPGRCSPHL